MNGYGSGGQKQIFAEVPWGKHTHTHSFPPLSSFPANATPPAAIDTGSFGIKGSKQDVASLHSLLPGIRLIPTMTAPTATLAHV